jgi:hypothetical protein
VCHLILVLLYHSYDLLIPSRNCILELCSIIAHMILMAELSSIVLLDEATLLLKVNENVDGIVELGRDRVTVVITRILTARIALRSTIVVLTEHSHIDLTSTFNIDRQLLNAVKAVGNPVKGVRSDSLRHSEDLIRDQVITLSC